jgi:hypothetical protein
MKRYLVLLLLPLSTYSQLLNNSFENWYRDSNGQLRLVGWNHVQKGNNPTGLAGTSREANAQHLTYALKLSRWYDYTWDKVIQKAAINFNPVSLTGYYKYSDNHLTGDRSKDTAYIRVLLTKWNPVASSTDTVGEGYIEFGPAASYTAFSCSVHYSSQSTADSLLLEISPSKFRDVPTYCVSHGYCSFFSLDNLELKGKGGSAVTYTLIPNPTANRIHVALPAGQKGYATIFNSAGQLILKQPVSPGSNSFDIRYLSAGLYMLQIVTSDNNKSIHKFLKN